MAPLVSIIMPTLNSAATLGFALESIARQSIEASLIEILVIDGGSTDATVTIAREFGCRVLVNERVQPEFAKLIGLTEANGKYAMFMDSDEALCDARSLEKKLALLQEHAEVRNVVTAGLKTPPGYRGLNDYINRFGEPFSYFMYGIDGGDYVRSLEKRYATWFSDDDIHIAEFSSDAILPICDAGAHFFDLHFLKSVSDITRLGTVPVVFPLMALHTKRLAVIRGDYTMHYSATAWNQFLKKIRWRVISNLHGESGTEGYANREPLHPTRIKLKKMLFVLYACSIAWPLIDAIRLSIRYKETAFLLHAPATYYTISSIAIQYVKKVFGIRTALANYGK